MIRKVLHSSIPIFFLFNLLIVPAQSNTNIELFDIGKNKITKTFPTNPNIQLEVEKVIEEIDNIVKKLNPIPDNGYMIKIPLEPSVRLENEWIYALIDEVILIIPKAEKPYLLIFDDENNLHFLTFETEIDTLLDALEFHL